jgi:hypothetical protein
MPRHSEATFPLTTQDDPAGRSMVQVAWLTCPIEDDFTREALGILAGLLIGDPAAPLYQALLDSRLGRNPTPGSGYHDDYRDTFFAAGLQGTDPEQTAAIEALILATLERVAAEGFPAERVAAALHQYEFSHREVSGDQFPYGLSLLMRCLGPWLHADKPLPALQLEENLAALRRATAAPEFFPGLIRRYFLANPHRVTLLLRPDHDHARREESLLNDRLEAFSRGLDAAARKELVAAAATLQESQERTDDTSCLPTLTLADIDRAEPHALPAATPEGGDGILWFAQPTNGISYLSLQFDTSGLPAELRPWVPLFCTLLPQIGAAGQDYLAIARRITAVTGGLRLGTNFLESPFDIDRARVVVELRAKALDPNQAALCQLLTDLLGAPDFSDLERLRTVIGQVRISLENSIPGAGHSYAARAAAAGLTPTARLREEWSGMSQVRLVQTAAGYDQAGLAALAKTFAAIAGHLFTRKKTAAAVTAQPGALPGLAAPLAALLGALPSGQAVATTAAEPVPDAPRAVAWSVNVPLAYVAQVFRTVPYDHPDAAPLLVLAKLLRADFLHREIREKGGAYGGLAGYNADGGLLSLLSYRDPHLLRTLDVYRQATEWACRGDFTAEMLQEAILAAFGDLDRPLSPGGRGHREFLYSRQGVTLAMRQGFRDRLLACDQAAVTRVAAAYLREGVAKSAIGILAGEELLSRAHGELERFGTRFDKL